MQPVKGQYYKQRKWRGLIAAGFPLLLVLSIWVTTVPVDAHVLDELSNKSRLCFHPDEIELNIELVPGVLISPYFLETLDPDQDGQFTEETKRAFSQMVADDLIARMGDHLLPIEIVDIKVPPAEELLCGIGTIYLNYRLPVEAVSVPATGEYSFVYENRFLQGLSLCSLHLKGNPQQGVSIIAEERDEITQDIVEVIYLVGEPMPVVVATGDGEPAPYESSTAAEDAVRDMPLSSIPMVAKLVATFREGTISPPTVIMLIGLALIAGALHAFTPGHGKTVIAAFLAANKAKPLQAAALGLLVALTHSLSIYIFGFLALVSVYMFMPGIVIPVMGVLSGILIIMVGSWMLFRLWSGRTIDHSHLSHNLSVLKEKEVNVLIDGSAADAADVFAIAAEEPAVLAAAAQAGAAGVSLCSLGCETHSLSPLIRPEHRNLPLVKRALKTGAVDAIVVGDEKRWNLVRKIAGRSGDSPVFRSPLGLEDAVAKLQEAVSRFPGRDKVHIPGLQFSWRNLVSVGLIGGMVPCPDALAILLVALSMGQVMLGMAVVFSFSIGLALLLMGIGIFIVISGKGLSRSRRLSRLSKIVPYCASVTIIGAGIWMAASMLLKITG